MATQTQYDLTEQGVDLLPFKQSVIPVPLGWEVVKAVVVTANPFAAVVDVTYETPSGLDEKTIILRRPAYYVFAVRGERVLVVNQMRHGAGRLMTELPGGMGKGDEAGPEVAVRELAEEGGIDLSPDELQLLGVFHRDPARSPGLEAHVYLAELGENIPTTATVAEPGYHPEGTAWVDMRSLFEDLSGGEVADAVFIAAVGCYLCR